MLKDARHDALLRMLKARGAVAVGEVSKALRISPATVRRDIVELEGQGRVERTWGGVRLVEDVDSPFPETVVSNRRGKQRIGEAAAALIPDGATVIFDVGTTVFYAALAMKAVGVTILTPSLPTFEEVRGSKKGSLVLLGGQWSEQYRCFVGPQVVDVLARSHADIAFLGCTGISDSGRIRDNSHFQSLTKRAIIDASTRSYVLADSSKFPGQGTTSPCDVDAVDGLITDATHLAASLVERCRMNTTEITQV